MGLLREAATTLRLSSNSGYQLIVRGVPGSTSRVWVQSSTGEFVELTAGASVTVAHDAPGLGETLRDVHFRFLAPASGDTLPPLPVRYDIAINPTL
jgi:hypothetical protein